MKNKSDLNLWKFISWTNKLSKNKHSSVILLTMSQVLDALLTVIGTLIFKRLVDHAASGEIADFGQYALIYTGITAAMIILKAFIRYLAAHSRTVLENTFRAHELEQILTKDYSEVTALHTGDWITRLGNDCTVVADGIVTIAPNVSGMIVKIVGSIVLIISLLPGLNYSIFLFFIGVSCFIYYFRKILRQLHKEIQKTRAKMEAYLLERISALMIIHSYSREKNTMEGAWDKMNAYYKSVIRRNNYANITSTGFSVMMEGSYVVAAIYCGYEIVNGRLSYGTLVAVLQAISQIRQPLSTLTGYLPKYYAMLGSAERLMEAESFRNDNDSEFISPEEISTCYHNEFKAVRLDDVSFTYKPRGEYELEVPQILDHIGFTADKGDYIAITGESGVGKSTILKLLMSLYPLSSGTRTVVLKDREESLDSSWRGLFAYVPQQNLLLSGKIREIIAFNDPERMKDDEGIMDALGIAGARSFIERLPNGIDTELGERGSGLSEGQMQRIAVARAIFSNHPILLLDEATSALDTETEHELLSNLKKMTDRTVIIVTHRLEVLDICDKELHVTQKEGTVNQLNNRSMEAV